MYKWIGGLFIFLACAGYGCSQSIKYKERISQLKGMVLIVSFLQGEIRFTKAPLWEAFQRLSGKCDPCFSMFLKILSESLREGKGGELKSHVRKAMEEGLCYTSLKKEDLDTFYQTVTRLGYLDQEMQLAVLEKYRREEEEKIRILITQLPKQQKIAQSIGIFGGFFLLLLLM